MGYILLITAVLSRILQHHKMYHIGLTTRPIKPHVNNNL